MFAHQSIETDEPRDAHDARCEVWHGDGPCDCRDGQGHAPRVETPDPMAARARAEKAWQGMTLCERAEEIDRIAAGGGAA